MTLVERRKLEKVQVLATFSPNIHVAPRPQARPPLYFVDIYEQKRPPTSSSIPPLASATPNQNQPSAKKPECIIIEDNDEEAGS
jgi:hypothetical protein